MHKQKTFLALFLLTTATFLLYSPVLNNSFIFDDTHWILAAEKFTWSMRDFFSAPVLYFRPFVIILFHVQRKLFGINAFAYYVLPVAFHAVNTSLVFLIARTIGVYRKFERADFIGFLSALTFLFMFSHSAAVLVISASMHNMLTAFYLLCVLSFLHFYHTRRLLHYFIFILSYILGLLADAAMVTLPLVIFAYILLMGNKGDRKIPFRFFLHIIFLPVVLNIVYLLCYSFVIKEGGLGAKPSGLSEFLLMIISFTGKIFLETLGLIRITENYPVFIIILFFLNVCIFLCLSSSEVFSELRVKNSLRIPCYIFYMSSMLISSLPYVVLKTNEMFSYDAWTRYRYSYLPSVFFSIFIGSIAGFSYLKLSKTRPYVSRFVMAAFFAIVLTTNYWGVRSAEQTYDYYGKLDKWILSSVTFHCSKHLQDRQTIHLINVPSIPQVAMSHSLLENLLKLYVNRNLKVVWLTDDEFQSMRAKKTKEDGCFVRLDTNTKKFSALTP